MNSDPTMDVIIDELEVSEGQKIVRDINGHPMIFITYLLDEPYIGNNVQLPYHPKVRGYQLPADTFAGYLLMIKDVEKLSQRERDNLSRKHQVRDTN